MGENKLAIGGYANDALIIAEREYDLTSLTFSPEKKKNYYITSTTTMKTNH